MKNVLNIFLITSIIFLVSCNNSDSGACDNCSGDSLTGQWEKISETIEYSLACGNDMLNESYIYNDDYFYTFSNDGSFYITDDKYDDIEDAICLGNSDLKESCIANIDDLVNCSLSSILFIDSAGGYPLDVCIDSQEGSTTIVGTFNLYTLGSSENEGCVQTWTAEFSKD